MNEGLLQNMKGQAGDVAIVGMACLFPGAGHVRAFWENIVGKMSAIGDPPPGWDHGGFFFPDSDEARAFYCRRGGFLRDLAEFDPLAYGVMPNSVDGAEPEHFLALRVAHEALADAGYLERPFARDRAGVILGRWVFINRGNIALVQHTLVIDQTLRLLRELHPEHSDEELAEIRAQLKASLPPFKSDTAAALVPNVMCGRIANRLDLRGPNFAVDAACASSLIAVDLASEELRSRRCDLMLAGGVNVGLPPLMVMGFCEAGVLSRNQTIRPFDVEADGTLLGEGVGMVVLKRLADAERDSDRIYAVIKGVGVPVTAEASASWRHGWRARSSRFAAPMSRPASPPTRWGSSRPTARHRHRRRDGDPGAATGLRGAAGSVRTVRPRLRQVHDRPHYSGGRRRGPHQGRPGSVPPRAAAHAGLRASESAARARPNALLRQHGAAALGSRWPGSPDAQA